MNYTGLSCVYKITYIGNCLPPYYIGSTYLEKLEKGYLGTPTSKKFGKTWKSETKNNPHLFKIEILSVHSTREEAILAESDEQRSLFVPGNILWVNQSYSTGGFISNSETAKKAHQTSLKRNKVIEARIKGHQTRRVNGTDKTGVLKGIQTKIEKGIPIGATKESAVKRKETIIANGGAIGWTKESQKKGIETKRRYGIFEIAASKMADNSRQKSKRENVNYLRNLSITNKITLGKGWYKKSDDWINNRIRELSSSLILDAI